MVTEVIMPRKDWAQVEGTVAEWVRRDKDAVRKGELIAVVESMKVTSEIEAPTSGFLHLLVKEGTVVPVGGAIALITSLGETLPPKLMEKKPEEIETPEKIRISPAARKLAKEHKIDITKIQGTGPEGRISRADVEKHIKQIEVTPLYAVETPLEAEVATTIPLEGIRRTIAERMLRSTQITARVTLTTQVDMSQVVASRQSLLPKVEKKTGVRLSFTHIIVKAVAKALEEHPIINSILLNKKIYVMKNVNIGVAVALEDGLIVPVIHSANKKSLFEIAAHVDKLVKKARRGKLSAEEVSGGTFTITNLGMFDVDIQTSIMNVPESAILGVGRILETPISVEGKIEVRPMMHLSLSFDHQVFDGAVAAKFLKTLKEKLESPTVADPNTNTNQD